MEVFTAGDGVYSYGKVFFSGSLGMGSYRRRLFMCGT